MAAHGTRSTVLASSLREVSYRLRMRRSTGMENSHRACTITFAKCSTALILTQIAVHGVARAPSRSARSCKFAA